MEWSDRLAGAPIAEWDAFLEGVTVAFGTETGVQAVEIDARALLGWALTGLEERRARSAHDNGFCGEISPAVASIEEVDGFESFLISVEEEVLDSSGSRRCCAAEPL